MKEDIPFEILEIFDPIVRDYKSKIKFSYSLNENELIFNSNSKFYFKINYKDIQKADNINRNIYIATYYPQNENNLREIKSKYTVKNLEIIFKEWLKCLEKYQNTKTFLDDPIIEKYQKEILENTLKFIPETDDDEPYLLDSQIKFISYLDHLRAIIEKEISITVNDDDRSNLENSVSIIKSIENNISKLSKGEVKQKFSLSLAHIAKASLKFFNTIAVEIIKELSVKALIGS